MSLWTDARVKELMARVDALEKLSASPNASAKLCTCEADPQMSYREQELIHDYTVKFGKPPHHRMSAATIQNKINE